jgi:pyridoxine 4-dehydrogenase
MGYDRPADAAGLLGIGDKKVNRMGFGAMRVTGEGIFGPPGDRDGAVRVLRRSIELGVNFVDTADSYGPEVSENLIADAFHPYPDDLVIATKAGFTRPGPGRWVADCRPQRLKKCVDGSLGRLRSDSIHLLQLHTVDPDVPIEESLGALVELKAAGKIRNIGVSNVDVAHLERARSVTDVVSVQNRYSVSDRGAEDVLRICEGDGIVFIPWAPVARGVLARPGGGLDAVAKAHGATPSQVALAWLLHRSVVMLPIPGTSNAAHLEENTAAAELRLSAEDLESIEEAARR